MAQAYTVVYLVVTVGLVIPVHMGIPVGQRLGFTSLGPALMRLFYQNL